MHVQHRSSVIYAFHSIWGIIDGMKVSNVYAENHRVQNGQMAPYLKTYGP